MSEIVTEINETIGLLVFDAQEKLNSLNEAMWRQVPEAIAQLEADEQVRVIVLRGAGQKAFSAGADISEFDTARAGERAEAYNQLNHKAFAAIETAGKPTIAMVDGYCLGGGFLLALSADMILASDEAVFSLPPAKLGLGFDIRWIALLLKALPPAFAKEMLFTGGRYKTDQLLGFGAINQVLPREDLLEATMRLAHIIAENAPLTISSVKTAIDALCRNDHHIDFEYHDGLTARCTLSDDYAEGRLAFSERRKPLFQGR